MPVVQTLEPALPQPTDSVKSKPWGVRLWLAMVLNLSQPFVYLAQIDRFYSMPLLLLTLTLISMCMPKPRAAMTVATGVLTVLTVLSHNVTVAVFVLAGVAACLAWAAGRAP